MLGKRDTDSEWPEGRPKNRIGKRKRDRRSTRRQLKGEKND